jgi:Spy/CpxP family protein refolding chaperone
MIRRSVVLLSMLAVAGTALAQAPAPSQPPPAQWHGHHQWKDAAQWRQKMEQRRMERLAVILDLTPAQRQQVGTIFADEHARMRPAMQQVRQAMERARAAHEAARKETLQRLTSVLSPEQMKKFKALMPGRGMMHAMMMHRMMMHGMGGDMDHGMDMGPHGMPGAGDGPGAP